jgi:hypothetical protein
MLVLAFAFATGADIGARVTKGTSASQIISMSEGRSELHETLIRTGDRGIIFFDTEARNISLTLEGRKTHSKY